ncbi:DUF4352 domain-containing protein [Planotetraspora kaengkrachanensis]|uniref:DUF4352 domain-containing protein n=1 Tax=Planotetraspora kaengkrachanensis TaxID=575193 RepID=A0A8J3PZ79_9ACTN|nr:DUF4352 domain-containing protein [Planotetraspora kaengkrachanensis]GIG83737.1 hypothetical protein Pka01_68640 [Planotetraspora kaengkrachanensis]
MTVTQQEQRTARPAARRQPERRSVFGRVVAIVAGLALAAAAVWAQSHSMSYEQKGSYLTTKGEIGQFVETNRYTVKVTTVTAAHSVDTRVTPGSSAVKVETNSLFVLVNLRATSRSEPMRLNSLGPPLLLTADGRRYRPTDKVDESLTFFAKQIQPGFWSTGTLVYEVPPTALPGARFVFIPPDSAIVVDNSTPEAEIDLGLTDAAAARLVSRAEAFHPLVSS